MNEQLLTAALNKALSRVTDETGLVGGVVNVIKGGKTIYTYEYGYADRENKLPMTQDTLFDVASTSKAWTVMLAAQCVDDGLLDWDEPIKNHIPEFTMVDKYAGEHLSARDTASHRSGLPGHDFLREKIYGDRENLMKKTAFLEPNVGFRSKYQYNNHMFILLGYLVERVRGGQLWEDQIVERIAKPLGIDQIRIRGINKDMDQVSPALPYCSDGYKTDRCGYATNYHSAPCGGIRISMKNMAKWIAAMSRGGVTESGQRLCSEKQFKEISRHFRPRRGLLLAEERQLCPGLAQRRLQGPQRGVPQRRPHRLQHSGGLFARRGLRLRHVLQHRQHPRAPGGPGHRAGLSHRRPARGKL